MVIKEEDLGSKVVLTPPISLDDGSNYRAPNILKRVLTILANVRPGSDLTRFQLPPSFNLPKSQLQCYGEAIYCSTSDLLTKCCEGETPLHRIVSVVAWSMSTLRPLDFGVAPYNPILGETHHVSRGTLNVMVEQVSHHPPVTALHATNENEGLELIWYQSPVPKFYGTHIETEMQGKMELKLHNKKETYTINSPNLVIRFLPMPRVDWIGNASIKCHESGLEARISYGPNSFLCRSSSYRSVKGKIFLSSASSKTLYEISGHWDRTVMMNEVVSDGKQTIIYDAKRSISSLKTPVASDPEGVEASESTVVWGEVSRAIMQKNWNRAREEKTLIEERQRELTRQRNEQPWHPKYFTLTRTADEWECSPIHRNVPPAPITVDL